MDNLVAGPVRAGGGTVTAGERNRSRATFAEVAWNGRRLAYGDIPYPTDAQKVHALAWLLASRMPWWAGGGR